MGQSGDLRACALQLHHSTLCFYHAPTSRSRNRDVWPIEAGLLHPPICLPHAILCYVLFCRYPVGQIGNTCFCFVGALPTRTLMGRSFAQLAGLSPCKARNAMLRRLSYTKTTCWVRIFFLFECQLVHAT